MKIKTIEQLQELIDKNHSVFFEINENQYGVIKDSATVTMLKTMDIRAEKPDALLSTVDDIYSRNVLERTINHHQQLFQLLGIKLNVVILTKENCDIDLIDSFKVMQKLSV